MESVCLVKECRDRELEEWFGVRVVDDILSGSDAVTCLKELKGKISNLDKERRQLPWWSVPRKPLWSRGSSVGVAG